MPGLTQRFPLVRWRLLICVNARTPEPSGSVTDAGFSDPVGCRQTHGADVRRRRRVACAGTDAIRSARRGPPDESRHAVPMARDRPADAVEDQPLELIRPAAAGPSTMNDRRPCALRTRHAAFRRVIVWGPMSALVMILVRAVVSPMAARTLLSP